MTAILRLKPMDNENTLFQYSDAILIEDFLRFY